MRGLELPPDLTIPGCWIAARLRKLPNPPPEDEIQRIVFNLGRNAATNMQHHWPNTVALYEKMKDEVTRKIGTPLVL